MKSLFNNALKSIVTIALCLAFVNAQDTNKQARIRKYETAYSDFTKDLNKIKADTEASQLKVMKEEVIVSEGNKIIITDTLPTEEDKRAFNARKAEMQAEISDLSSEMELRYKTIQARIQTENKFENVAKDMDQHESEMLQKLNSLTDEMAEQEMEKIIERKEKSDTTVIRMGSSKIVIIEDEKSKNNSIQFQREKDEEQEDNSKKKKQDNVEFSTLGMSLGLNSLMYKYELNLPSQYNDLELNAMRSWNFNLRLIESKVNLYKHNVNLLTGLSVDWNNYRFRNNTVLSPKTDTLLITRDSINFTKNKLMTQNLMGHLMLQFETKPGKNGRTFDIGAGVFGGYLLNARTKQVSELRGKNKFDDDFQLNNFRYGICGRIGYGAIDLYVNYTLNDIFRENLGPAVQNLSFGINFTGL